MISDADLAAELELLEREAALRIPSSLATDKVRSEVIYGRPAVRHTPRYPSLSERDGERNG